MSTPTQCKPHIRKAHGWWSFVLRGPAFGGLSPRDMLAARRFCDKLNGVGGTRPAVIDNRALIGRGGACR